METYITLVVILIALMFLYAMYVMIRVLDNHTLTIKTQHEEKLAMAEAQSKSMSVKSFEDLRITLDYLTSFYVAHEVVLLNKDNLTETEKIDMLEQYAAQISSKVKLALSPEMQRQLSCYVDQEFLDYYIRKSTTTMLVQLITPSSSNK